MKKTIGEESEFDKKISYLNTSLDIIKKRVLAQKQKGYDTFLSELLIGYAPSYINMYAASQANADLQKCIYLFREIDKEAMVEELRFVDDA